jgi:GT2 family glycosyltransferase
MLCDYFKAYQVGTLLAHRWVFERIGNFDPAFTLGDESDWFVRLMESGIRLGVLSDVLLSRRIHAKSMSAKHDLRARNWLRPH